MTKAVFNVNFDNRCKRCGEPGAEQRTGLCLKCLGDIVAEYPSPRPLSDKTQVVDLANSVLSKYFPELEGKVTFTLESGAGDSVSGRARFGFMEVTITYGDGRILEPKYRFALVPLIAHELAHLINPVAPDKVMGQRLPPAMMALWEALVTECSIEQEKGGNRESDN